MKHNYSPYESVARNQNARWRGLAIIGEFCSLTMTNPNQYWKIDKQTHVMFHRIIYGYVAIQVPSYFKRPEVLTRHMHPLAFRRIIHTNTSYYQYSFYPAATALWNKLEPEITLISDPNSFKERVRVISHLSP